MQTLTVQPTVQDGRIVFEDSAVVRAVRSGHVLVIDEADKAPTHVTCILKVAQGRRGDRVGDRMGLSCNGGSREVGVVSFRLWVVGDVLPLRMPFSSAETNTSLKTPHSRDKDDKCLS